MKTILAAILFVAALVGLGWVLAFNDLAFQSVFKPKYEQVRRNTFEQSKAYNQGMAQEIQNMQFQYVQADEKHKKALRTIILHRVADYDINKLPYDTQQFIKEIK